MCRQDDLYELLVRRLTKDDPVPVREPDCDQESGWRLLYQALYHRERNWAWGNPQSIKYDSHANRMHCSLISGRI